MPSMYKFQVYSVEEFLQMKDRNPDENHGPESECIRMVFTDDVEKLDCERNRSAFLHFGNLEQPEYFSDPADGFYHDAYAEWRKGFTTEAVKQPGLIAFLPGDDQHIPMLLSFPGNEDYDRILTVLVKFLDFRKELGIKTLVVPKSKYAAGVKSYLENCIQEE